MKKAILPVFQVAATAAILWRIFGDQTIRADVAEALGAADARWLIAAVLVAACSEAACATRWWIVLRAFGVPLRWRDALAYSALGLLYSLGLPGSAGGDAVRVLYVMRRHPDKKIAAAFSVLADRFCGLAALAVAMGWTLAANRSVFFNSGYGEALVWAAMALCGGGLIGLGLWWTTTLPAVSGIFRSRFPGFNRHLLESGDVFRRMWQSPRAMALGVVLSGVSLAAHFFGYYLAGCAFDAGVSIGRVLAVMPVVDTITALPVALYGLGLREAVLVTLLGGFHGVPAAAATLMSLGGFGAQAVVALSGILWLPFVNLLGAGRASSDQ